MPPNASAAGGEGEVIGCCAPALSVVFDSSASEVCSFCFASPPVEESSELAVELAISEAGFGLQLDTVNPPHSETAKTIVTRITKESPNRGVVQIGDVLEYVDGQPVKGGHEVAVPLLRGATKGGAVRCTVHRPALLSCRACNRFACCAACVAAGLMTWHSYECGVYRTVEGGKGAGESATVRMLLRYKLSSEPKVGEWSDQKEPISMLKSLQANPTQVPSDQLAHLARISSLPAHEVASLIYQGSEAPEKRSSQQELWVKDGGETESSPVRTNACEIVRNGKKVGCALSALVGWHNHDCQPNAQVLVDEKGQVSVGALRNIAEGEEVRISYIDSRQDYDGRQKVLTEHYGFECNCERCKIDKRANLKRNMDLKRNYLAGQRR
ncbi:MAG: hypothetical protein SGPRY_001890 [Prymnesium sp.]